MKIQRIDHIGIVVNDLEKAKEFFVDFGFTVQGEAEEQSELTVGQGRGDGGC